MKRIARVWLSWPILLLLTACAASQTGAPTISAAGLTAPARSVVLPPPTLSPIIVTHSIGAATLIPTMSLPISPIVVRPTLATWPTSTPTLMPCSPLPTPTALETQSAVQHFEHGLMVWLQAKNEIWVLIASPLAGQFYWRVLPNLWSEGQPENDPGIQPPPGKYQPVRGFGMAWRVGGGSSGPQRDDLGWALDEEMGFSTELIYYPQGFYSPDCAWMPKSGIYELKDNRGNVIQFVGEGGVAKIAKP